MDETNSNENDFVAQTVPGLVTEVKVDLQTTVTTSIQVTPVDTTPPSITIISPTTSTITRADRFSIDAQAQDAETGVVSQVIRFNTITVQQGDLIDPLYYPLGQHTITVDATDFVGNSSRVMKTFNVTATQTSTLVDIERAFELGWIDTYDHRNYLMVYIMRGTTGSYWGFRSTLRQWYESGFITRQGFDVLWEDAIWLINHY